MATTPRLVLPELLDELSPSDPRSRRSRRDLRRVHRAMGSLSILRRSIADLRLAVPPSQILELGAGDGSLMLRLAQTMKPPWRDVSLTVLDRLDLVSAETRQGYESLGWRVTVVIQDALEWAVERNSRHFDLCITTLFLHHFDTEALSLLMRAIAMKTGAFVACEPRRHIIARLGSELIGLLGANRVTREDAVTSVAAGFRAHELTDLWRMNERPIDQVSLALRQPPTDKGALHDRPIAAGSLHEGWECEERAALPFIHRFTAVRRRVHRG